ncbi:hypothetical protein [Ralstonia solanacearum]|uniref:hypothetical protein n=1 Tax=Ralstonia solanacearum TaxID=305 RepID=UPI0005AC85F9|nr:hypothetical protein [Ralstonia solanacearum]
MTNVTESNKLRIINMIRNNKGIRTPELADRLEIENPQPYIAGEIERNEILVEKVLAADTAHTVNSYSINPDNPPDVLLTPHQRTVRAANRVAGRRATAGAAEFSAALSSRGVLTIKVGRKSVDLDQIATGQLITYLDRINVEQVMKAAGTTGGGA